MGINNAVKKKKLNSLKKLFFLTDDIKKPSRSKNIYQGRAITSNNIYEMF